MNSNEKGAATQIYYDYDKETRLKRSMDKEALYDMYQMDANLSIHKYKYFGSLVKELLPIAWHPDRAYDWCLDEDDKKYLDHFEKLYC